MQFRPKTVAAVAVSAALVLGSGVMAATMVLDLRVPGLTATNVDAAAPAGTPPVGAAVTTEPTGAASPAGAAAGPAPSTLGAGTPGAGTPGPGPAPFVAVAGGGSTGTPTPTSTQAPATTPTPPPTVSSGIPAAPAGCSEPEWDSEHRTWKCHVDDPERPEDGH